MNIIVDCFSCEIGHVDSNNFNENFVLELEKIVNKAFAEKGFPEVQFKAPTNLIAEDPSK